MDFVIILQLQVHQERHKAQQAGLGNCSHLLLDKAKLDFALNAPIAPQGQSPLRRRDAQTPASDMHSRVGLPPRHTKPSKPHSPTVRGWQAHESLSTGPPADCGKASCTPNMVVMQYNPAMCAAEHTACSHTIPCWSPYSPQKPTCVHCLVAQLSFVDCLIVLQLHLGG